MVHAEAAVEGVGGVAARGARAPHRRAARGATRELSWVLRRAGVRVRRDGDAVGLVAAGHAGMGAGGDEVAGGQAAREAVRGQRLQHRKREGSPRQSLRDGPGCVALDSCTEQQARVSSRRGEQQASHSRLHHMGMTVARGWSVERAWLVRLIVWKV